MTKLFSDYLAEAEAAEKKGTYAALHISKPIREKLHIWMEQQQIKKLVEATDYHCTVVYSTIAVPEVKNIPIKFPIKAKPKEWKVFGPDKILVLAVDNKKLFELFDKTIEMGAKTDYPSYVPHISVATGFDGDMPEDLPDFNIIFDQFRVGTIDEDFSYSDKDE